MKLYIFNKTPSPENGFVAVQDENNNIKVGHTWLMFENKKEKIYRGWGNYTKDKEKVFEGKSVKGALLNSKDQEKEITSSYEININQYNFNRIELYFDKILADEKKYNLGGSAYDKKSLNCTELILNVLKDLNIFYKKEKDILFSPFEKWKNFYPESIPEQFSNLFELYKDLEAPSPNQFEFKLKKLKELK